MANKKANNNPPAPTTRTATFATTFITVAQIVAFCKASKVKLPITAKQAATLSKTVLFYNSQTNQCFTGHNAVASNISVYSNFTTGLLARTLVGKLPMFVANKKGQTPATARKLGYFKVSGAQACGKLPASKGSKRNNVVVLATTQAHYNTAIALAQVVSGMPAAYKLAPCSTFAG